VIDFAGSARWKEDLSVETVEDGMEVVCGLMVELVVDPYDVNSVLSECVATHDLWTRVLSCPVISLKH
jgi:hypothetical protein